MFPTFTSWCGSVPLLITHTCSHCISSNQSISSITAVCGSCHEVKVSCHVSSKCDHPIDRISQCWTHDCCRKKPYYLFEEITPNYRHTSQVTWSGPLYIFNLPFITDLPSKNTFHHVANCCCLLMKGKFSKQYYETLKIVG